MTEVDEIEEPEPHATEVGYGTAISIVAVFSDALLLACGGDKERWRECLTEATDEHVVKWLMSGPELRILDQIIAGRRIKNAIIFGSG